MSEPNPDRFAYDDAAYVLGALSEDDRRAFEAHLATCAACRARVDEVRGIPAMLVGVSAADLDDEPLPDTLLPGLMRRAASRRRRQRGLVAGLAAVAAACLVALAVAVWPGGSSGPSGGTAPRALQALVKVPVHAEARLVATSWGTEIHLHCQYDAGVKQTYPYELAVVDRAGHREMLGSWALPPGKGIDYTAGTALRPAQIARVLITLTNGQPVLQLTN